MTKLDKEKQVYFDDSLRITNRKLHSFIQIYLINHYLARKAPLRMKS